MSGGGGASDDVRSRVGKVERRESCSEWMFGVFYGSVCSEIGRV